MRLTVPILILCEFVNIFIEGISYCCVGINSHRAGLTSKVACVPGRVRKYSNNNKSNNLAHYLAGLIEGDGSIYIPKTLRGADGKLLKPTITVWFASKDRPSAELLKNIYGGNLYNQSEGTTYWRIQSIASIIEVVNSVNGKFRTPKIHALHALIDFLNAKQNNIIKLSLDTSPLASNAWLAGFIDSDGCFSIKGFTQKRVYIGIQFYLPQRTNDTSGESMEPVMQKIADFFQVKLGSRAFSGGKFKQFVINTSNKTSNQIIIEYLSTFPLLSSKFLDYKDWEKANFLYVNKLYKSPEYYEQIRELKNNMNTKRTTFSWLHHKTDIYDLV